MPHPAQAFYMHIQELRGFIETLYASAITTSDPERRRHRIATAEAMHASLSGFMQAILDASRESEAVEEIKELERLQATHRYTSCMKIAQEFCEPGDFSLLAAYCGYVQAFLDAPEQFIHILETQDTELARFSHWLIAFNRNGIAGEAISSRATA